MKNSQNEVIVTNWEKVEKNDFYLSKDWAKENADGVKAARKLQKEGNLFVAYTVPAVNYCVYRQMDAFQIFIDEEGNEIMDCESAIIEDKQKEVWKREI
jgi:hypothetical protein